MNFRGELVELGLMRLWEGSYIITRKGQIVFGESDPYQWQKENHNALSLLEAKENLSSTGFDIESLEVSKV